MKLNKKYVIGTNIMWFEIEMYKDFIDGLVNLLDTNIENKENITIDLCLNLSQHLEKLDTEQITEKEIIDKFYKGVDRIKALGYEVNTFQVEKDEFYFHADYRRDLNYNYCKKVDYVMWGETDSFFPKEAFWGLESLSQYTDNQNIHRYIACFGDRKMWDSSWDATIHNDYVDVKFVDDDKQHLNLDQAKSPLPIETMNKINENVEELDIGMIQYPKLDGSCLVLSSDLIKYGVNIPSCMIYNDDHGLSIMSEKLLGKEYKQFVFKNLLKVHARRHPNKRLYVMEEDNPNSFGNKKNDKFNQFKQLSDRNIQTLISANEEKFFEYEDFKKITEK
jgi:hypothetical protein|tara:strand:+ start:3594 stop:4595 length:1002 start_codon:yes stop_codon:yes gene_type:complete